MLFCGLNIKMFRTLPGFSKVSGFASDHQRKFREEFHKAHQDGKANMIAYVTVGTNDLPRAAGFYDAIAKEMGVGRYLDLPDRIGWGTLEQGGVIVMKPYNGEAASVGNGCMVALAAKDKAQVDRIHKIALEQGGTDEGAPGPRAGGGFYAAYFRDLDGNKLNAFVLGG